MQFIAIHFAKENPSCQANGRFKSAKIRLGMSAKNSSLNLRIRSELKKRLELIAASEGRSVAQVCEAFLQAGLVAYDKEGSKYVSRYLGSHDPGKQP